MTPKELAKQHWAGLAASLDVGRLVPPRYAAYRPLVAEALLFFLQHLCPQRLAGIVGEQSRLPDAAGAAERLVLLLRHCPTLHKLGQVVARDRRLAPELRRRLQDLESLPPTTPRAAILAAVRDELGDRAGLYIAPQALAEASVAVVVPFSWRQPGAPAPIDGVLKILKPGVEQRLREELEIWSALGGFLEERCARHGLPVLDYRDTLDSVRTLLLNEIHLDREQAHLRKAREFYADCPQLLIPRLLPLCTPRITAMERVHGVKVTDACALSPMRRRRLAETIVEALIAKPLWSDAPAVAFHADPHAGNLLVTGDGRLAILDWSLVAELSGAQRRTVMEMALGALSLDEARVSRAVVALARRAPDGLVLREAVAAAFGELRRGMFPGLSWMLGLLDRLALSSGLSFSEALVLFRKTLLTVSGVVSDVSSACSVDQVLIRTGAAQFIRELPGRAWAPADSRAFGTHVSNADLFELWFCSPVTAVRFWIGIWRDCLAPWLAAQGKDGAGSAFC